MNPTFAASQRPPSANPFASMYWACSDILSLSSELAQARDLPSPEVLQQRINGLFDQMTRRCQESGIANEDALEARYAIAAFTDEQILRSAWPGRAQWFSMPLQYLYFRENTAGEGFFRHMAMLQNQGNRVHVLQIYYLCLCLGFQGQYAVHGGQALAAIVEQVGARLGIDAGAEVISPHAEPKERLRGLMRRDQPLVAVALGLLGVAIIVFFALKLVVMATATSASHDLTRAAEAQAP